MIAKEIDGKKASNLLMDNGIVQVQRSWFAF